MSSTESHPKVSKPNEKSSSTTNGSTKRGRGADDEGWGGFNSYMDAKKYKLNEQFSIDGKALSGIFQGVSIYINGYTKPSSDVLQKLIVAHGGKFNMYLSKTKVTHIIATSLPNSKFHLAKSMPIVRPEWITDSIAAGKRLVHKSYLLLDNKPERQTGLKSFPSISSLSRSNSTSSTKTLTLSTRAEDLKNDERCIEIKGSHIPIENTTDFPTENTSSSDVGITSEELWDMDHEPNINNDSIDYNVEPVEEIVYNSEDEDSFHKSKQHLYMLSKAFVSVNSPNASPFSEIKSKNECLSSEAQIATTCNTLAYSAIDTLPSCSANQATQNGLQKEKPSPTKIGSTESPKPASSPSKLSTSTNSVAKAGDKGFLTEFYSNSRLHHISQWGAQFKAYVADIQQKGDASFPGRVMLHQHHIENMTRLGAGERLKSSTYGSAEKIIMHIDMDCFFVSVGLLSRPDLRGKPIAVTHSRGQGPKPDPNSDAALEKALWNSKKGEKLQNQGKGSNSSKPVINEFDLAIPRDSTGFQTFHSRAEIACCSYEARKEGIKNGMYMGKAKTLCPDLKPIPYDFEEYNRVSRILYDLVASFTHDIEAVSCDEMFVDCSDVLSDTGATAIEFANMLRNEVFNKTGCTASVGIGPNILLARLATKKAKPDGVFQVYKSEAKDFIKNQSVSDLPGVGYSTTNKLTNLGVTTCGDLQNIPKSILRKEFGPKTGESLHRFSLGVDDREVKGNKQRKSVSAEVNYGIRFTQESDAFKFLQELSEEVSKRLDNIGVNGRSITLKLMIKRPDAPMESAKFMGHGICNTINKSSILPVATRDGSVIGKEVISMYKHHKVSAPDVRGIGIQVQRLESLNRRDQEVNGLQSILHFAVSKKSPFDTAATVKPTTNVKTSEEAETTSHELNYKQDRDFISLRPNNKNGGESLVGVMNPIRRHKQPISPDVNLAPMKDVSFLLSPSQVNENILEELPPEIAEELRNGIEQHKKQKNLPSTSNASSHNEPQAIVLSDDDDRSNLGRRKHNVLEGLPSESQLDMSCFHALPRSLQMELEMAYVKRKQTSIQEQRHTSPIKGTALGMLRSPSKDKGKRLKKRRGRPVGSKKGTHTNNTGKLKGGGKNLLTKIIPYSNSDTRKQSKSSVGSGVDVVFLDEDSHSRDVFEKEDQSHPAPIEGTNFHSRVAFCGAHRLKDVKCLFKEWMTSCSEPEKEDIIMVSDYLTSLIHQRYLEHAFCLVKFLMRHVQTPTVSSLWKGCIEIIAAHVQSVVMETYNAEFKLF